MSISPDHPLNRLFAELLQKHLIRTARIEDIEIVRYVSGILVQFTHVDALYRIRNSRGRRLEEVAEMLIESNPLLSENRSILHEREVRRHVGDYTLFLTGLFPDYVRRLPARGLRMDGLIDYMQAGKESYRIVSSFDQFEFRTAAPLFRRLSEQFELCVFGLNLVKAELEANQRGWYQSVAQNLDN